MDGESTDYVEKNNDVRLFYSFIAVNLNGHLNKMV